jgi:outer membrane protein assembly factor BamB
MRPNRFCYVAALFVMAGVICAPARAQLAKGPVRYQSVPPVVDEAAAYQANAQHNGQSTAALSLPLHIRWISNVGTQYYTSPVIANGKVAVSASWSVIAMSASTGKTLWSSLAPQGWSGLTEANGVVYAAQTFGGPLLEAFNFSTGQTLWSQTIPNASTIDPPVVSGNVVYTAGGAPTTLYAFRAPTGTPLWSRTLAYDDQGTTPAVVNGRVYVSYVCSGTFAFSLAGGALWHFPGQCSGDGGSAPAYCDGTVSAEGTVVKNYNVFEEGFVFSPYSGAVLNTFPNFHSPPACAGGREFVTVGSALQSVDLRTGQVFWTASIGMDEFFTPPLIVGNFVFAEGASGTLYAFSVFNGALLQSIALGAPIHGDDGYLPIGLAAAQGILVAPSGNNVVALSGS